MCCFVRCTHRQWLLALSILFIMECYLNTVYYDVIYAAYKRKNIHHTNVSKASDTETTFEQFLKFCSNITIKNASALSENSTKVPIVYYKYPLINSTNVSMEYKNGYNSSYYWFVSMKPFFKNLGDENIPKYTKDTPTCQLNQSSLGPILVNKMEIDLAWVEQQNPDVNLGGYHAPAHCRALNKVAVIVPYRNRRINLIIFLHYIHPLLKKQLLDYRIFVIEQYGTEKFNKGTLYNIAFLETQRFGTWDCLIFHDVDLIPEDERISYSCPIHPTHMSPAVEMFNYILPYDTLFGGVTALTPAQFETVNGYSNCYWNWGGEDDDIQRRLLSKNFTMARYNITIARYATLPHPWNEFGTERNMFLMLSRLLYLKEGLLTTKYNLINVTQEKLYTHILADVNPTKIRLDTKSLMHYIVDLHGKSLEYGRQELQLRSISAKALREYLQRKREKEEQRRDLSFNYK